MSTSEIHFVLISMLNFQLYLSNNYINCGNEPDLGGPKFSDPEGCRSENLQCHKNYFGIRMVTKSIPSRKCFRTYFRRKSMVNHINPFFCTLIWSILT